MQYIQVRESQRQRRPLLLGHLSHFLLVFRVITRRRPFIAGLHRQPALARISEIRMRGEERGGSSAGGWLGGTKVSEGVF